MSEYIFKLPDLGEGTVEAEIIEWHVHPGDVVKEGQIIVDVMTDKANIEVPAPASGRVLRTSGQPGDMVAVGTELLAIETESRTATPPPAIVSRGTPAPAVNTPPTAQPEEGVLTGQPTSDPAPAQSPVQTPAQSPVQLTVQHTSDSANREHARILASPALRRQAMEHGIDLAKIHGSGPRGRILRRDLDTLSAESSAPKPSPASGPITEEITEVKIIGVRRLIAERLQAAKREIPHFAYVEEIDITALDRLRARLNERSGHEHLTLLPFIGLALIRALQKFPQCNALHDAQNGVLRRYSSVHLGIATQTADGLKVPVIRQAERLGIDDLGQAIRTAATQARDGTASRESLSGSTFTLTSLGRLGGIVSTPVINAPEMGIVGVNKAVHRPMVIDGVVEIRLMMNLSSSFDHRFIDGFDAASMIQTMKELLEEPALLFIPS